MRQLPSSDLFSFKGKESWSCILYLIQSCLHLLSLSVFLCVFVCVFIPRFSLDQKKNSYRQLLLPFFFYCYLFSGLPPEFVPFRSSGSVFRSVNERQRKNVPFVTSSVLSFFQSRNLFLPTPKNLPFHRNKQRERERPKSEETEVRVNMERESGGRRGRR